MKKLIKITTSILSLLICIMPITNVSAQSNEQLYEIVNNDRYDDHKSNLGEKIPDEFIGIYNEHCRYFDDIIVNIYESKINPFLTFEDNGVIAYTEWNISVERAGNLEGYNYRILSQGCINLNNFEVWNDEIDNESLDIEEINEFISDNNIKAEATEITLSDPVSYIHVDYDKDAELEDMIELSLKLNQKYIAAPFWEIQAMEYEYFDNNMTSDDVWALINQTNNGDANEDNVVNVQDCAYIARKIASGEAESLPNSADFNGDGKVNIRDAAAIANYLANK